MRLTRLFWLPLFILTISSALFGQTEPDKSVPMLSKLFLGNRVDTSKARTLADQTVLAKIGSETITVKQFNNIVSALQGEVQVELEKAEPRKNFLEAMVETKLFSRAASQQAIDQDADLQAQFQWIKEQLIAKAYKDRLSSQIQVSDEEVRAFYEKEKEKLRLPDRLEFWHILYPTEELALSAREDIVSGKRTFEQVAAEESRDKTSGPRGGNMGELQRGQWVPDLEKAAFSLKENEVSQPFKSTFGWHLIRVRNARKAGIVPLEEAKVFIKNQLAAEKQKVLLDEELQKLKSQHQVEIHGNLFLPSRESSKQAPPQ